MPRTRESQRLSFSFFDVNKGTSTASRIYRLPQRLDYTLIPAPLGECHIPICHTNSVFTPQPSQSDLSLDLLPVVAEKSPLPAVVITPASPSSSTDFSIAFLPAPKQRTVRERFGSYAARLRPRARLNVLLLLLVFICICHMLTHRLAGHLPLIELSQNMEAGTNSQMPFIRWFNLLDDKARVRHY